MHIEKKALLKTGVLFFVQWEGGVISMTINSNFKRKGDRA